MNGIGFALAIAGFGLGIYALLVLRDAQAIQGRALDALDRADNILLMAEHHLVCAEEFA